MRYRRLKPLLLNIALTALIPFVWIWAAYRATMRVAGVKTGHRYDKPEDPDDPAAQNFNILAMIKLFVPCESIGRL